MQIELDLSDVLLMTIHPSTAQRVADLYTSALMEDWHTRRAFYTEQVDQANNAHLRAWWESVQGLFDAAIVDPDGSKPETIRAVREHDARYAALTEDEIALWNETMCWHLETNVDRDQWVEAALLAKKTRQHEES